jgi:hypothetical protein
MTPVEKERVTKATDKLKARIVHLKEQLQAARIKAKGKGISTRARDGAARPAASKGRTRGRARSAGKVETLSA